MQKKEAEMSLLFNLDDSRRKSHNERVGDADIFLDGLSSNSKTSSVLHRAHVAK